MNASTSDTSLPQALATDLACVAEARERFIESAAEAVVDAWTAGDDRGAMLGYLLWLGASRLDRNAKLADQQQFFKGLITNSPVRRFEVQHG